MTAAAKYLITVLCFLALTGCWDKKELSQLTFVMGMGIDMEDDNFLKVTAQVIIPTPPTGGGMKGDGGSQTWTMSTKGRSISEAVTALNRISPRRLVWNHLVLIVLNEKMAKNGLKPYMTWFEREAETNSSAVVVISKDSAETILNLQTRLGRIPAKTLSELILITKAQNIVAQRLTMHELNERMTEIGIDPSVDMIETKKMGGKVETVQIIGSAIFNDDRLVGILKPPENAGAEFMLQRLETSSITTPCPDEEDKNLSILITDFENKVRTIIKNEKITVRANILVEANIQSATCSLDFTVPKNREIAEKYFEDKIKKIISDGFKKAAAKGSDIYGIGREIRRRHPQEWREIQKNWHAKLPDISLDIQVDSDIHRTGLIRQHPKVK